VLDTLKSTVREFLDDDAPRMAAALSYYTVFSLPAILILLLLVAGFFMDPTDVESRVLSQVEDVLGDEGAEQIQTMIQESAELGGGPITVILSLLALAFGATGAFFQLQAMLNKAWSVAPDPERSGIRTFVVKRVLSFGMIMVVAFLLLVSLVISAFITRAGAAIAEALPGAVSAPMLLGLDIGLSLVVFTILFAAIFKVMPDARITWRDVGVGAGFTAVLFLASKYIFAFFLSMADPGSAFGAAGSLAVVMIWIYVSSMVLFLGAEFTQVWARNHGTRIVPDDGAVRVSKETGLRERPGDEVRPSGA
jgi:membrane protein